MKFQTRPCYHCGCVMAIKTPAGGLCLRCKKVTTPEQLREMAERWRKQQHNRMQPPSQN